MGFILKVIFFYEYIDWIYVSEVIGKTLGREFGIILAGFLKMGSQIVVPLICFLFYIIAKKRGKQHARKIQKLFGSLQRKCRIIQTTGKYEAKHQLRKSQRLRTWKKTG